MRGRAAVHLLALPASRVGARPRSAKMVDRVRAAWVTAAMCYQVSRRPTADNALQMRPGAACLASGRRGAKRASPTTALA